MLRCMDLVSRASDVCRCEMCKKKKTCCSITHIMAAGFVHPTVPKTAKIRFLRQTRILNMNFAKHWENKVAQNAKGSELAGHPVCTCDPVSLTSTLVSKSRTSVFANANPQ